MLRSIRDVLNNVPLTGIVLSERDRINRQINGHGFKPLALYLAQFFLFVVIAVYFAKISVLSMGIVSGYGNSVITIIVYVIDVLMMLVTIDAVLGISSGKPLSWCKVMRGAILLFMFSMIGSTLGTGMSASSLVTFSPVLMAVICVPVAALMFTRAVREYFVLPMLDMPPLRRWIGFVFFSQLYPERRYKIAYEQSDEKNVIR